MDIDSATHLKRVQWSTSEDTTAHSMNENTDKTLTVKAQITLLETSLDDDLISRDRV